MRNSFAVPEEAKRCVGRICKSVVCPVGDAGMNAGKSSLLTASDLTKKPLKHKEPTAQRLSHFAEKNSST